MRPHTLHTLLWSWLAVVACGPRSSDGWPPVIELAGHDPELVQAIGDARARVSASPRDLEANLALAQVLDANDLDAAAEEAWLRVTALDSSNARGWYHLARVRERRGASAPALEALERALALAPDYAPAHARAGRLWLESGRLVEAEAALTRALELDPSLPSASMGLARLELLRARPAAAIAVLEPLVARLPHEPYVNGLLARACSMQGERARASQYLLAEEEAGAPSGRDPWQAEVQRKACGLRVRIERAKARLAAGDPEAAWKELEPLAERANEPAVLDAQCQVLLALGRPEEVLARTEPALARASAWTVSADASIGTSSLLTVKRVLALRALGENERALAELEAELQRNPRHPSSLALWGEILFDLERHPQAIEAFERARAAGRLALADQLQLGRARAASGDVAGGLRELEAAVEAHPSAPKPWAYRSELLALEGRAEEARASLEEARQRGLEPELVALVAARLEELAKATGDER